MVIRHIVISGGGPTGLMSYGAAKHLAQEGVWAYENIETIYGTSVGALIGAMLCLKHDWITLDDYIIKRPWEKVMVNSLEMFELFVCKGMAKLELLDDVMQPLLESKDLSLATTLSELHARSGIALNVFTVELNTFKKTQLSHVTHPDLLLMDAIKMSACMPMLFQPIIRDGCCYIDGGIIVNYPLHECMQDTQCRDDEVLGLQNEWNRANEGIGEQSSLIDYMRFINLQLTRMVNSTSPSYSIVHEVVCHIKPGITPAEWFSIMSDAGQRLAWIEAGIAFGQQAIKARECHAKNDADAEIAQNDDEDKDDNDDEDVAPPNSFTQND